MRILYISKYYEPFTGGTEQVARDLVNALKDEHEQKVICFHHELRAADCADYVDGIEVIRCRCEMKVASQSLSLSYAARLKKVLREFRPEVIFFHMPNPFVAEILLREIPKDAKLVLYWHLDIVRQKVLGRLFDGQNRAILKRADRIIATSPNYIEGSKWLSAPYARPKCIVIPNCINEERLVVTEKAQYWKEKLEERFKGKILCLAVGRHVEYKGFSYLIEAAKELDQRFEFVITGTGPLTAELKAQAIEAERVRPGGTGAAEACAGENGHGRGQHARRIHLPGKVSDDQLIGLLSACDIFCFPSVTKNEAFGLALAEGMYFGKPAVTFQIDGSGVNYVNIDRSTGIEVENRDSHAFAEALRTLADDPALREKYGKAAAERVRENFLYSQFCENVRAMVAEL